MDGATAAFPFRAVGLGFESQPDHDERDMSSMNSYPSQSIKYGVLSIDSGAAVWSIKYRRRSRSMESKYGSIEVGVAGNKQ